MRSILFYGAAALIIAVMAIFALLPMTTSFVDQWSRRDIKLRSRLVATSVRDQISGLLAQGEADRLSNLFERMAADERLLAVGLCDGDGAVKFPTSLMPATFSCQKVARADAESFSSVAMDGRSVVVGAFPVGARNAPAHLVLLHDFSFAEQRGAQARGLMLPALAGVGLGGALLASLVSFLVVRGWLRSTRRIIDDIRAGRSEPAPEAARTPLAAQIRQAMQELSQRRPDSDSAQVAWNAETLRQALTRELPATEVIVVSNREPYIHNRDDEGRIALQIPASGLVAALEPVMRACGGTWIAHGSGSADKDTVDAFDRVAVPPASPVYKLRRLWLSDDEQDGYYYGLANEGLWPLCHIAFVRPTFREEDWKQYRAVNKRFAEAVVAEARRPDPIVLVQDYHFALLPKMIREKLPKATIITFWHIPWPNSETFGICPWKEEIVEGLLGSSILGFHTQFHCNNFLETVDRFVESRIDREHDVVSHGGQDTLVRPYPISIEWPPGPSDVQPPVGSCRAAVRRRLGLAADIRLGVGVERFDYTKGILDRMRAVDSFLTRHPGWKGRFSFVQVAAPTRSRLPAYRQLQDEAVALAAEINARHETDGIAPIVLLARHHGPEEVFELFRAADLCIVSSLHDGMNLVAKEFVASRDDEAGVLILSSFTGASRELSEALLVNPYDAHAMGEAIERALTMPGTEQRARMRLMRELVRSRNVYRWAGEMLLDAAKLRRREQVLRMVADETVRSQAAA